MASAAHHAGWPTVLGAAVLASAITCTNDYDLQGTGGATTAGTASGGGEATGEASSSAGGSGSGGGRGGEGGVPAVGGAGASGGAACGQTRLGPGQAAAYPSLKSKKIDGDLGDWGCSEPLLLDAASAAVAYSEGDGTPAVTVRARLEWDDSHLYFAAEVIDPTPGQGNDSRPYMNDSVELYLRGSKGPDANYSTEDHHFIVDHAGRTMEDSPPLVELDTDPAGFEAAVLLSADGYRVEAQVDAAILGGPWQAGRTLGFDLLVSDGEDQA